MPLQITESRRQTGAGRLLDSPGAALEVSVSGDRQAFEAAWREHALRLASAAGLPAPTVASRPFSAGLSLAVSAPEDALYAAAELNEAAARLAHADVTGEPAGETVAEAADRVRSIADRDRDPALVALLRAAEAHGVSALWDDDAVTLGLGTGSHTWHARSLPPPDAVAWDTLGDVPVALVTGTNGKSTTVRMLAAMATAAGHTPGVSTTDYVAVGSDVVETGDFSGPMGARAALRDRRATLGILEVARGGLLRRGVPVARARVACITNVAADHLGEFGVETVEELAEAKFVVTRALTAGTTLVLTADDPATVAEATRQADSLRARGVDVAWVALDASMIPQASVGGVAAVVDGHVALRRSGGAWAPLVSVAKMPCAMGGAAAHNVRNALSAVATGAALGLTDEALADGLRAFRGDATDNPGRANVWSVRGVTVVVDYAHNAHGLSALMAFAGQLPAQRRLVLLSCAGDRPNADIEALATTALPLGADRYLVADLPDYLRGRTPGEVPAVLGRALVEAGVDPDAVEAFADPAAAARAALAWATPGDVLLLVALSHRDEIAALLKSGG
ncbi:MAG TPA: Mur ligase family protein [Rubricoccaceae bacterium]|jgi:UDP-N-acetylmuramyl tripeptide synthase